MKTQEWLGNADRIVIECEEENINPYTLVSVTPLYMEGTKHSGKGGQREMTLQEALKIKRGLVVKNSPQLLSYLQTRMGKDIFD